MMESSGRRTPKRTRPGVGAAGPSVRLVARGVGRTDIGVVRERNEDAVYVDPEGQFFLVADGMGGHQAGHIASAMAIDVMRRHLEAARTEIAALGSAPTEALRAHVSSLVVAAVREAQDLVYARSMNEPATYGMGTTLDVAVVAGAEAIVAHVGDSRTYLFRAGAATQLTRDHTFAQAAVLSGALSPEDALASPMASVLSNAIGVTPDLVVDLTHHRLEPGDRLLLCSDGLYELVRPDELAGILWASTPAPAVDELIAIARARGGHDNITGLVVEIAPSLDTSTTDAIPQRLARGSSSSFRVPANPLASVADDALCGIIDDTIREESGPARC